MVVIGFPVLNTVAEKIAAVSVSGAAVAESPRRPDRQRVAAWGMWFQGLSLQRMACSRALSNRNVDEGQGGGNDELRGSFGHGHFRDVSSSQRMQGMAS